MSLQSHRLAQAAIDQRVGKILQRATAAVVASVVTVLIVGSGVLLLVLRLGHLEATQAARAATAAERSLSQHQQIIDATACLVSRAPHPPCRTQIVTVTVTSAPSVVTVTIPTPVPVPTVVVVPERPAAPSPAAHAPASPSPSPAPSASPPCRNLLGLFC